MSDMGPSQLVDICIEYICRSFHCYVREVPEHVLQGRITLQFGWESCILPARVVEQMLSRLNRLHMIDKYGQVLLNHPGMSGALKRLQLPGCILTTTDLLLSLSNLKHLTDVNLAFCRYVPDGCQVLQQLLASAKQLTSLKLNFVKGDLGFDLLSMFTAMKDLDLSGTWVMTDHLIQAGQAMYNLESLDISSTGVTMVGGLRAVSCLPNLRSIGLHDLLVVSEEEDAHSFAGSGAKSEFILFLSALEKVVYLDVSHPRFYANSSISKEDLLKAVLSLPQALVEIDVSDISDNNDLKKLLKGSPLLHQLLYVGCLQSDPMHMELETMAPQLKIGSLKCTPEHVDNVFRSEYLKRPLILKCLFSEFFITYLYENVQDEATWIHAAELTLSAFWLHHYNTDLFHYAEFLVACFLHKFCQLPQVFPLVQRYVEFIVVSFDKVKGIQLPCLDMLNRCMQPIKGHAGLSVQVATFLVRMLRDFDVSRVDCTEHQLAQCLHEVVSWNDFHVRANVGFVVGAVELLVSRLKDWSLAPVAERNKLASITVVVTEILADLTDGIPNSGENMLALLPSTDCIGSLLLCLEAFNFNEAVEWGALCVLGNMAEGKMGLSALLCHHPSVVESGLKYMGRSSSGDLVTLAACHLIAVLLTADQSEWTGRLELKDSMCHSLVSSLLKLEQYPAQSRNIGYTSIQPLLNMIKFKDVTEVRCFGMWMLASMCKGAQSDHYFKCLQDDSCAGLKVVQNADIPPNMANVFINGKADIINGYSVWSQREQ